MRKIQNFIFYTILFATTGILVISLSYNPKVSDLFSLMAAVGFVLMPVGFSLAMFLSFQPVLVKSCQKVRIYGWDNHDFGVLAYGYLGYFGLFISTVNQKVFPQRAIAQYFVTYNTFSSSIL